MLINFGQNIKKERQSKNLTLKQISEKTGLSVETIRLIEDGKTREPRLSTLFRIVDALELPLQDVFKK